MAETRTARERIMDVLADWVGDDTKTLGEGADAVLAALAERTDGETEPQCAKCGSHDVVTRYRGAGERLSEEYIGAGAPERDRSLREKAACECLFRRCRTCQWWWVDPVVSSPVPPQEWTEGEQERPRGERVRLAEDADKDAERAEATAAALERLIQEEGR